MQVADNPQLLSIMLEDTRHAPDIYKPTNYWSVYENKFAPELRRLGLHDFRRRKGSILSTFGGTDLSSSFGIDLSRSRLFNNRITRRVPVLSGLISLLNAFLNYVMPVAAPYNLTVQEIRELSYILARTEGEKVGARSIAELDASLVGNPEDIFEVDGKVYTMSVLYYYLRYVYCCNYIDFARTKVIVELGSGAGKQVEVIKKLHPDICFLLFDIPPQLYVCESYLDAVFPESIVSYKDTRNLESIPDAREGKIFIFGNWKFPILEKTKIDLFWNAASFQEMEPDVVANYLTYVNRQASFVFLQEAMSGKEVAKRIGEHGVLRQTTLEDYKNGLKDFELLDVSPSLSPVGRRGPGYSDSFWKRTVL